MAKKHKVEDWLYGGQNRQFFADNRDTIRQHNCRFTGIILRAMMVITALYYVFDLNSDSDPKMRATYLAFFLVFLVLHLWHELWVKNHLDADVIYMMIVAEALFFFLLLVGPFYDAGNLACYVPVFFVVVFMIPIAPMTITTGASFVNLLIFAAAVLECKSSKLAIYDIVDASTCFMLGVVLGQSVLKGRLSEITAYKLLEQRSESALMAALDRANKDALTGVQSRIAYEQKEKNLNGQLAAGEKPEFALVVCDVNNLKQTNDRFGHEAGDKLIVSCARIICEIFTHSPVYRIGGDEFTVVLQGNDYALREELMRGCEARLQSSGLSLARGIGIYDPSRDKSVENVFIRADAAMYENKKIMKAAMRENAE